MPQSSMGTSSLEDALAADVIELVGAAVVVPDTDVCEPLAAGVESWASVDTTSMPATRTCLTAMNAIAVCVDQTELGRALVIIGVYCQQ